MFTQNAGLDDFLDGVSDGLEASSHNFASLLINTHIGKDEGGQRDKETNNSLHKEMARLLCNLDQLVQLFDFETSRLLDGAGRAFSALR